MESWDGNPGWKLMALGPCLILGPLKRRRTSRASKCFLRGDPGIEVCGYPEVIPLGSCSISWTSLRSITSGSFSGLRLCKGMTRK